MTERTYIAIDLKSFYASVECRERGLDPLDTNLVVADESRTDKTICLAVTPSLKSYGISAVSYTHLENNFNNHCWNYRSIGFRSGNVFLSCMGKNDFGNCYWDYWNCYSALSNSTDKGN